MTWTDALLAGLAGFWVGGINTVVGSGTLVSFPILLALGLPPVTANVTNTVGMFPGSLTGAWGYRAELVGQRRRIVSFGTAAVLGSIGGAILLLTLPPGVFTAVVPWLIGLAVLLVLAGPFVTARLRSRSGPPGRVAGVLIVVLVGLCAVYGGYFGAAQGVLMIGFMGLLLPDGIQRLNAIKNLLVGLTNAVAAVIFAFTADVRWAYAGCIAVGAVLGGLVGARVARRLSPWVLRACIAVIGVVAIVVLVSRG